MDRRSTLVERYEATRARTEALAAPLSPEDQQLQAMPSASPTKWHRGHTTWFWETLVLGPRGQVAHEPRWAVLFNSYYESLGPRHARPERGLLSRPSCDEIAAWRRVVDERMVALLSSCDEPVLAGLAPLIELGIAHEEQHQELILTDLLAAFARNPLKPVYRPAPERSPTRAAPAAWIAHEGGVVPIGAEGAGFAFDNEGPRHAVSLRPFVIASRLVTVGEWAAFAEDGGYRTPSLWLSDGLDFVRAQGIEAPAYTRREGAAVVRYGLHGERALDPDEPVVHLSLYEADALATWLGARLPTEFEWEAACAGADDPARPVDLEPGPLVGEGLRGAHGVAWQWTRSAYAPYPGFRAPEGPVGEYNGKFMINQVVLRGGSALTPPGHSRRTYRNFWPPDTRFQRTGLRLARDA